MSQGQGLGTWVKERGFGSAFSVSINLSKGERVARYSYWHVDLNAGSGWNHEVGCDGSPMVFLDLAAKQRPNYRAFFCDHDPDAIGALAALVGKRAYCFECENTELLPIVSAAITAAENRPQYAAGTVVCDPNGYIDERTVPIEQLAEFAVKHPCMDLVFNLNIRTYQLSKAHKKRAIEQGINNAWAGKRLPPLTDFPALFNRSHWLISNIRRVGAGDGFVIAIGRNYRTSGHAALGHYPFDSPAGQRILNDIEGIKAPADPQPSLPGL